MISIIGRAPTSSILYLNRIHGEEVQVELQPIELWPIWNSGRGGIYLLMDTTYERFGQWYETDPGTLAVGPAAQVTDIGAIGSVPITKGRITHVDTWAGRGVFDQRAAERLNRKADSAGFDAISNGAASWIYRKVHVNSRDGSHAREER